MSTATATPLETVTPLVREWCAAHADRVQACYLTYGPKDSVTLVLVQRQDGPYDEVLSNALDEFLDASWRANRVLIIPWQTSGPEEEVCQVYPAKPSDRVFGD
jgi:hypothetical protein